MLFYEPSWVIKPLYVVKAWNLVLKFQFSIATFNNLAPAASSHGGSVGPDSDGREHFAHSAQCSEPMLNRPSQSTIDDLYKGESMCTWPRNLDVPNQLFSSKATSCQGTYCDLHGALESCRSGLRVHLQGWQVVDCIPQLTMPGLQGLVGPAY